MMNVNELLDAIEVTVDQGTTVPLMPGKHVVDVDKIQAYLDETRVLLPEELHQAKIIVNDRAHILQQANEQANLIVRKAEARAKAMVSDQEIVKGAQKRAAEIIQDAQTEARNIRQTMTDYCENMLKATEKAMTTNALQLKTLCTNLRKNAKDATR